MAKFTCVGVTGASGFIASHIVALLLEKGYDVHGTVRDPTNPSKVKHLESLPGAKEHLKLFKAELGQPGSFEGALIGCDGIIHVATPIVQASADEGKAAIYEPGVHGLEDVLQTVEKLGTCNAFVLTSSMSAMAPQPPVAHKSEECWSDEEAQKGKGNWYGATKTKQERLCHDFFATKMKGTRFAAVCPTMVVGPMLQPSINRTMERFIHICKEGMPKVPNDSMSFIDVRDCAALHVAALERDDANGRYMALVESWHWNNIVTYLREIVPSMPESNLCEGDLEAPTTFDRSRQDSLGVSVRSIKELLAETVEDLRTKGLLPKEE